MHIGCGVYEFVLWAHFYAQSVCKIHVTYMKECVQSALMPSKRFFRALSCKWGLESTNSVLWDFEVGNGEYDFIGHCGVLGEEEERASTWWYKSPPPSMHEFHPYCPSPNSWNIRLPHQPRKSGFKKRSFRPHLVRLEFAKDCENI